MTTIVLSLVLFVTFAAFVASAIYFKKLKIQHGSIMRDYRPVEDSKNELSALSKEYSVLQDNYKSKRSSLVAYEKIVKNYDLGVGTIDMSIYSRLHEASDVILVEEDLDRVKKEAAALVKAKRACVSKLPSDIAINGSKAAAKTFVSREIRLRIRCLDNEVKAALAAVEWNNVGRLVKRLQDKFQEVNEDSKLVKIFLEEEYLNLKKRELRLTYELKQLKAEIKEEEREERSRVREGQRDEERVIKELAKAERDRSRMEELVKRELERIGDATEAQKQKLALYEKELEILREKESRAISLAQQTRSGYVYVISNTNSFESEVCKIGMTRRLDPNDRVKELGDASVPDRFKVHAFIHTEDAPALEKYLHNAFGSHRENLVNRRKEFFRVKPEDVLGALHGFEGGYTNETTALVEIA